MYIAVRPFRANGKVLSPGEQVNVDGWDSRRVSALVREGKMSLGSLEVLSESEYEGIIEDPNKVYAVYPDPEE